MALTTSKYTGWVQKGENEFLNKIEIFRNKIPYVKRSEVASFLKCWALSLFIENNSSYFHQFFLGWCLCVTAILLLIHCDRENDGSFYEKMDIKNFQWREDITTTTYSSLLLSIIHYLIMCFVCLYIYSSKINESILK